MEDDIKNASKIKDELALRNINKADETNNFNLTSEVNEVTNFNAPNGATNFNQVVSLNQTNSNQAGKTKQSLKEELKQNFHAGRRQRMTEKLENHSVDVLAPHELLEMLLYNVYKQADTNEIAHNLLHSFGGIRNLLSAPKESLMAIPQVGEKAANFILLIAELFKKANVEEFFNLKLTDEGRTVEYLRQLFKNENTEKFYIICADAKYKIISTLCLGHGDSESATFSVDETLRKVLLSKAKFILISHNHINGGVKPSMADFLSTDALIKKLLHMNVTTLDHIIINGDDYCSFRENGLIDMIISGDGNSFAKGNIGTAFNRNNRGVHFHGSASNGNNMGSSGSRGGSLGNNGGSGNNGNRNGNNGGQGGNLPISKGGTLLDDEYMMYMFSEYFNNL
jgi:DNA repair protein RadC